MHREIPQEGLRENLVINFFRHRIFRFPRHLISFRNQWFRLTTLLWHVANRLSLSVVTVLIVRSIDNDATEVLDLSSEYTPEHRNVFCSALRSALLSGDSIMKCECTYTV